MKKVPLYFNFVGSRRDMLDTAMESYDRVAGHLIDVRVHYSYRPRRFTECLNEILKTNDEPYFFAHFDSVLTDISAIEKILSFPRPQTAGLVAHCLIVDLLMLVIPKNVRTIGGWDEAYSNSCMDLDLHQRLHRSGKTLHLMHSDVEQGRGVDHFNASAARKDPAMRKVYGVTMQQDYDRYYDKYHNRSDPGYLHVCDYIKKEFGDS